MHFRESIYNSSLSGTGIAFRQIFLSGQVSDACLIGLSQKLTKGEFDGRTSSTCLFSHIGSYMAVGPAPNYLKAIRHLRSKLSKSPDKNLEEIERFGINIKRGDTPVNSTHARYLYDLALEALERDYRSNNDDTAEASEASFSMAH